MKNDYQDADILSYVVNVFEEEGREVLDIQEKLPAVRPLPLM